MPFSTYLRYITQMQDGPSSAFFRARHQIQKSAARHMQVLQSIESQIVKVGQEEAQLTNLIRRAEKALYAIARWKKTRTRVFFGKKFFKAGIAEYFSNRGIELLDFDFDSDFSSASSKFSSVSHEMQDSIVLLNSNDLHDPKNMKILQELYTARTRTLFVAWLWDNHHMVSHSAMIGLCVDILYPAHSDNFQILNRYCPFVRPPLPAACHSWTKAQARELGEGLTSAARPIRLSGGFFNYAAFGHRNSILRRVRDQEVGKDLIIREHGDATDYWNKTPEEQWNEWASSKTNLVIPILSDLPIRVFDALLTGNIPLLPRNLAHVFASMDQQALRDLPIVWFDYADLPDMAPVVKRGCDFFDTGGSDGILARHRYALDHHMIEDRIAHILSDIDSL